MEAGIIYQADLVLIHLDMTKGSTYFILDNQVSYIHFLSMITRSSQVSI